MRAHIPASTAATRSPQLGTQAPQIAFIATKHARFRTRCAAAPRPLLHGACDSHPTLMLPQNDYPDAGGAEPLRSEIGLRRSCALLLPPQVTIESFNEHFYPPRPERARRGRLLREAKDHVPERVNAFETAGMRFL